MKELYADFNDFAGDGILPLTCVGSIESIAALGTELVEGEEVCLTDGELRVEARLHRRHDGSWEAHVNGELAGATARDRGGETL